MYKVKAISMKEETVGYMAAGEPTVYETLSEATLRARQRIVEDPGVHHVAIARVHTFLIVSEDF